MANTDLYYGKRISQESYFFLKRVFVIFNIEDEFGVKNRTVGK